MAGLARIVAVSRPVGVYPGWHFGINETDPRLAARLRRAIWRYFNRRRLVRPIRIKWHMGLKLKIYLGNDLARCVFVNGCFEPNEFNFLSAVLRPGMVFIDVGANEGLFTLFASRLVEERGRVVSIDPSSREFARLGENLQLNDVGNVIARRVALSNREGMGRLRVAGYGHEGLNSLGDFVHPQVECSHFEEVPLMRARLPGHAGEAVPG